MITDERLKQLMAQAGMPESISLMQVLRQCDTEALHSMRTVVEQRDKLRDALASVIGASTKEELDALELAVRSIPGCGEDCAVALNAIHALRACAI